MKNTHIVYNPEGKPDGLYVITEMPEKPDQILQDDYAWRNKWGAIVEAEWDDYEKAVQSAIASAKIKVDEESKGRVMHAICVTNAGSPPWFDWLANEFKQGKVYELSGIELEVYEKCECEKYKEQCTNCEIQCADMYVIQLARIKTKNKKYCQCNFAMIIRDQRTGQKRQVGYCAQCKKEIDENFEPKQKELNEDSYFKLIGADKTHAIAMTIWDTLKHHKYKIVRELVEPKENQEHIWKEAIFDISRFANRDETIAHLKSKYLITRK